MCSAAVLNVVVAHQKILRHHALFRVVLEQKYEVGRAGSGHFFHGAGRVSGLRFWLGSGSGYWKCPRVNYGP